MRKRYGSLLLVLALAAAVGASPADDVVVLPVPQVVPQPMPSGVVTRLTKGVRYVIQSKVKCDVDAFPEGLVSVSEKAGPRDWTGVFAGGTGAEEDRHFDLPFLYFLSPVKTGPVEILVTPQTGGGRKRFKLDVDDGTAPIPPPKPVDPKPDIPPAPVPVSSFHVIFINERSVTLTQPQKNVFFGKEVEEYVTKNTTPENGWVGWRRLDKDVEDISNENTAIKAMWPVVRAKVTVVPCVAVEVNGKVDIIDPAATPAAMIATFNTYLGRK